MEIVASAGLHMMNQFVLFLMKGLLLETQFEEVIHSIFYSFLKNFN